MATYISGGISKATANTVTAMRNSADARRCPSCGRGSAIVRLDEPGETACRWGAERDKDGNAMCNYYTLPYDMR